MTLVLGGVVLLGIGVHVYLDMAMHRPIMGNEYHHVSLVLIILGLSTFLVALLGCLGSYKEYVFVVIINAVCYSVLTLGLFGVVAWLILQKVILKIPGKNHEKICDSLFVFPVFPFIKTLLIFWKMYKTPVLNSEKKILRNERSSALPS